MSEQTGFPSRNPGSYCIHQRLFVRALEPSEGQRDAEVFAREWGYHAWEHLLYPEHHLLGAADGGGHSLVNIGDEAGSTGEEVQDLQQTVKVIGIGSNKDDEVISI